MPLVLLILSISFTTLAEDTLNAPVKPIVEVPKEVITTSSCTEVTRLFGPKSKLTTAKKNDLWASTYNEKIFEWDLEVTETKKNLRGPGFIIHFKCPDPRTVNTDLIVLYADQFVFKLRSKKIYKVRAKLQAHSTIYGLAAEAVQFRH